MYSKQEALKELRADAKRLGMTFRVKKDIKFNGGNLYQLISRETKRVLIDNYVLSSAYQDSQNGYWYELHEKWIAN